jgi:hypothetical protein
MIRSRGVEVKKAISERKKRFTGAYFGGAIM